MEILISFIPIVLVLIVPLLLVVPLWVIYKKAGKNPAFSLFLFIPFLGFLIVGIILAFSRWPATEPAIDTNQ